MENKEAGGILISPLKGKYAKLYCEYCYHPNDAVITPKPLAHSTAVTKLSKLLAFMKQ